MDLAFVWSEEYYCYRDPEGCGAWGGYIRTNIAKGMQQENQK